MSVRSNFCSECRALADRHKAALIFDEIQCGLGRTGAIFAFQSFGVTPDIVAIAKPIAAGLPLGAFIAKEEFATAISPGQHGTTFGGGPLACRVALEYFAIVEEEKLLENVNKVGSVPAAAVEGSGGETRGRGGSARTGIHPGNSVGDSGPSNRGWRHWRKACYSTPRRIRWCDFCLRSCWKRNTSTRGFGC